MKIIKVDRHRVSKKVLAEAEAVLRSGGVIAFPTDTAYGLAADPANAAAVEKVCVLKGRESSKQLPYVTASLDQAKRFFDLKKPILELAEEYWPGPLSIQVPIRRKADFGRWPTAVVRVPKASWARALPEALGRPVTSTSANRAGDLPCYSAACVKRAFSQSETKPDLILDAGRLPRRPPSTIVKLGRGGLTVLRSGSIAIQ